MKYLLLAVIASLLAGHPHLAWQDLDPGYWQRTPLPQMGLATYYAPGVMDWVQNYRLARGHVTQCPECVGAVALLRAGDIGRRVWLQPQGGELAGPFLVVDCARIEDIPELEARNWAVDVDFELAQLWKMTRPLDDVIVSPDPDESLHPASGVIASFYVDPKDVLISAPTPTAAAHTAGNGHAPASTAPAGRGPAAQTRPAPSSQKPIITMPSPTPGGEGTPVPSGFEPGPEGQTPEPGPPGVVSLSRPGEALLQEGRTSVPLRGPAPPSADSSPQALVESRPTGVPILSPLQPEVPGMNAEPSLLSRVRDLLTGWTRR